MKRNLLNNWEVVEKLGEGSYAEVYKAYKKVDGIPIYCAVKHISLSKVKDTATIIESLKKEATIMQKLNGNKHIINYLNSYKETTDKGEVDCYIYMELAEDVEKYFTRVKNSVPEVLQMGIDICQALEACQDLKIIHRDIKPSNIFRGEDGNFKLGDFGAATLLGSKSQNSNGTYNYIAPEIYRQESPDFTSDLYSLGLVMYKLLNHNKLPFVENGSNENEAIKKRMNGKPLPRIYNLNPEIMDILNKVCAFDRNDRYQTPTELGQALKKAHFNITGVRKIPKESSKFEKTVSIQDMKKLEEKEKGSLKNVFRKNYLEKYKKRIRIILWIVIFIIIILLITRCSLEKITCEDGYIKKFNQCVKGYYSCEEGYTLNEDKCEKVTETIDATPKLTCEDGYELKDQLCVKNETKDAKNGYYCATGYTLNGNMCQVQDIKAPVVNANCPNGYTLYDNKCVSLDYQTASTSYSCPDGYTLSNGICTHTENNSSYLQTRSTCPQGGSLENNQCHIEKDPTSSWGYYNRCEYGYQYSYSDRKCHRYYSPTTTRYCQKGVLNGSTCVVTSTTIATINYECPSGYDLYGNQCAKTLAQAPNVTYTCDTGYSLSDNACVKIISVPAQSGYHCEAGYTISGSKCTINNRIEPTIEYQCINGYTLRDNKCVRLDVEDATPHYEKETDSN